MCYKMRKVDATYLLLRNGIYYFHCRIPKHLKNHFSDKVFIRLSLKTACRQTALFKSTLIRKIIMTKSSLTSNEIDDLQDNLNHMYHRGKILSDMYEAIDPLDNIILDDFFVMEFGSNKNYSSIFDKEAFLYYQKHHASKKQSAITSTLAVAQAQNTISNDLRLSDIIDRFITDKQLGDSWSKKSEDDFKAVLRNINDLCGNPLAKDLTHELIAEKFSKNIRVFPANVKKKKEYRGITDIHECIKIAGSKKLTILSHRSQMKYVVQFKSLLIWAEKRGLIDSKAVFALDFFKSVKNKQKKVIRNYKRQELEAIFYNDMFAVGKYANKEQQRHWGAILALYTGARANEIAQIKLSEIKCKNGIWYIDITDETYEKRLKTNNSRRVIPIHDDLISLGFLNYVEKIKSYKQEMLFMKLKTASGDISCRKMSDWFVNSFLKKLKEQNLIEEHKNFHSFRHTAINNEKQRHLNEHVMREIFGHGKSKDTHAGYQEEYSLEVKHNEMNKLNFGLDISKIKRYE